MAFSDTWLPHRCCPGITRTDHASELVLDVTGFIYNNPLKWFTEEGKRLYTLNEYFDTRDARYRYKFYYPILPLFLYLQTSDDIFPTITDAKRNVQCKIERHSFNNGVTTWKVWLR